MGCPGPGFPGAGLASLAEKTGTLTETFARLPEHYRDNLASVADLIFIGRSLERVAEGLQKVAAEALYGVGPRAILNGGTAGVRTNACLFRDFI